MISGLREDSVCLPGLLRGGDDAVRESSDNHSGTLIPFTYLRVD